MCQQLSLVCCCLERLLHQMHSLHILRLSSFGSFLRCVDAAVVCVRISGVATAAAPAIAAWLGVATVLALHTAVTI